MEPTYKNVFFGTNNVVIIKSSCSGSGIYTGCHSAHVPRIFGGSSGIPGIPAAVSVISVVGTSRFVESVATASVVVAGTAPGAFVKAFFRAAETRFRFIPVMGKTTEM